MSGLGRIASRMNLKQRAIASASIRGNIRDLDRIRAEEYIRGVMDARKVITTAAFHLSYDIV